MRDAEVAAIPLATTAPVHHDRYSHGATTHTGVTNGTTKPLQHNHHHNGVRDAEIAAVPLAAGGLAAHHHNRGQNEGTAYSATNNATGVVPSQHDHHHGGLRGAEVAAVPVVAGAAAAHHHNRRQNDEAAYAANTTATRDDAYVPHKHTPGNFHNAPTGTLLNKIDPPGNFHPNANNAVMPDEYIRNVNSRHNAATNY